MRDARDGYHWDSFGGVDGLGEGRYLPCALPSIPLDPESVDVVLSDHLLFTYPDFFNEAFHVPSIESMLQTARREVRLFPLISSASSSQPPYSEAVVEHVRVGYGAAVESVPYHFQHGANEMLRITKERHQSAG